MTTEPDKKTDAWMPLWIGAYLADTMQLTTVQHGTYFLLLIAYWRERAPLPDDDDQLRSIAKLERGEWKRMRPVIAKFFRIGDGVWWHKRVEKEIAAADARSKKASEKAAKAAAARWGALPEHASGDAPSMPQALPEDVLNECPTPSPSPSELRSEKIPPAPKPAEYPPEFELAWQAYPNRPGASKAAAHKAWKARVKLGADPMTILSGVQRYAAYCAACVTEPQFIKQPATFFGPDEHFLSDWTPPTGWVAPRPTTTADRRAETIAGLTNRGEAHGRDDRTIDVDATVVD